MKAPDLCPLCGADLPEARQLFGSATPSRSTTMFFEGIEHHTGVCPGCPDCNGTWPVEGQ